MSRLNTLLVIYLNDILSLGRTLEEILMSKGTFSTLWLYNKCQEMSPGTNTENNFCIKL